MANSDPKHDSDAPEPPRPTFQVYQSEADGVSVVHVETHGMPEDGKGPIIRVYLNDEPIFENPRYPTLAQLPPTSEDYSSE